MITAERIEYAIGTFTLSASLSVNQEYFVLLGMTGCGKTMFLENICGLRRPDAGRILIDGRDSTDVPPWKRNVGYVPQDGALFPHMNVARNIGFSLSVRREPRDKTRQAVGQMAGMLHIEHLLSRKIAGLSGGERQRVALARALVSNPSALILDEPVSALDEHTREAVCRELKNLQRSLRLSVVHVCHSFEEAQLVGDRVGIMRDGGIVQVGTVNDLLNEPKSEYVARILRHENIYEGDAWSQDGRMTIRVAGNELRAVGTENGPVRLLIRPWEIRPAAKRRGARLTGRVANSVSAPIAEIVSTGAFEKVRLAGDLPLVFFVSRLEVDERALAPGSVVEVGFPETAIHLLDG